jgi:outer membrane receptor for ferrienterochelin and colicin
VRINNNAFTAEDGPFRFGQGGRGQPAPQVVDRGGIGAFHGNGQFLFKDESLNARNPFASNKPPYQERQFNFDVSGPVVPRRLSTSFSGSQNEAQNVDTIHATLPDGLFALGITRPTVKRSFASRNTFQAAEAHSLSLNLGYSTSSSKNQGVGEFALPERASTSRGNSWNAEFVQFSSLSTQSIFESRFKFTKSHDETVPFSDALRINVLDAFSSGGAQNRSDQTERSYDFSTLYTRLGEKVTMRAGSYGKYAARQSSSETNFGGTFTFSSLESYLAGAPLTYRVTRGNPLLKSDQLELSFFDQNDWRVTTRLTLMVGVR